MFLEGSRRVRTDERRQDADLLLHLAFGLCYSSALSQSLYNYRGSGPLEYLPVDAGCCCCCCCSLVSSLKSAAAASRAAFTSRDRNCDFLNGLPAMMLVGRSRFLSIGLLRACLPALSFLPPPSSLVFRVPQIPAPKDVPRPRGHHKLKKSMTALPTVHKSCPFNLRYQALGNYYTLS
jgi:hypothetical protein